MSVLEGLSVVKAVRCAFAGHEIDDKDKLTFSTSSASSMNVKCKICKTPLIIKKVGNRKYSIKERYWAT